ncbi:MAG: tetratricopeptide repeat protein [Deltaproteobacteria bacterium]|nr:tetratricopeptide repeat protein [Deltaproteobacteria bacterium]
MPRLGPQQWATAALAACLILGCSSPEERVAAHIERAQEFVAIGDNDEAILEYRSALKIDPNQTVANEEIGDLLLRQGDLSGTFYLSEALRLDPERIDIAMELTRALLITGQIDEADSVIAAAKIAHPEAGVVYGAEAELLLYRNDPETALAAAQRAVELAPEDGELWLQLGRVHQGRIRMKQLLKKPVDREIRHEAIAAFEKADELSGGSVGARLERARMLSQNKQSRDAAQDAYIEAVELAKEQGKPDVHFMAAHAAEEFAAKLRNRKFRTWAIRQMLEADPSQLPLWSQLAEIVDDGSGYGILVYKELLFRRPDDPYAHVMFASYMAGRSSGSEAIRHLNDTIEGGLESPALFELMIRLQIAQSQLATARATFVQMSDDFPNEPETARAKARIALAEGRNDDAIEILRDQVREPDTFEYQRLMALAQYRKGELEAASDAVDRALELRGEFSPEGVRLRALIHHDSERWAETLRALRTLTLNGQTLSNAEEFMRVRALYGTGRPEPALSILERILESENPPATAAILYARREGANHPEEARAHLLTALEKKPADPKILEALVDISLRSGQLKQAMFLMNSVIKSGRARPETLLLRARVLHRTGRHEPAESDALRAFEADPSLPGAIDLLYSIYEAQGRLEEARTSFEEAEAAGVLHSGARLLLCRIYLRQGESNRARAMLEKVIREDPDSAAAKTDLAYLLAEGDGGSDLDRALKLAEEAQKSMRSDPAAADTVGYVFLRKGQHEAALQQFLYAIELNGDQATSVAPKLHYHVGLTLDALSRSEEAAEAFEKALALDSNFPGAQDARKRLERTARPS